MDLYLVENAYCSDLFRMLPMQHCTGIIQIAPHCNTVENQQVALSPPPFLNTSACTTWFFYGTHQSSKLPKWPLHFMVSLKRQDKC